MLPRDVKECWYNGRSPRGAVYLSLSLSKWAVSIGDPYEPLALVGYGDVKPVGVAVPWMLCSTKVTARPRAFLRACKVILEWMLEEAPLLVNQTLNQPEYVRLVRSLGFTIDKPRGGSVRFYKMRGDRV